MMSIEFSVCDRTDSIPIFMYVRAGLVCVNKVGQASNGMRSTDYLLQ